MQQEVYPLLITYQVLRTAISDAVLGRAELDPDRGSFTVALAATRDQVVRAAGVIAETAVDLVGAIGQNVLRSPDTRPTAADQPMCGQAGDLQARRQQHERTSPPAEPQSNDQRQTSSPPPTLDNAAGRLTERPWYSPRSTRCLASGLSCTVAEGFITVGAGQWVVV